jgi:hypothetical protein
VPKAVCPHPGCPGENDRGLVAIEKTGQPLNKDFGTAQWWRVVPHWTDGKLCPGSGKLV